jgi:hypothetical protein
LFKISSKELEAAKIVLKMLIDQGQDLTSVKTIRLVLFDEE